MARQKLSETISREYNQIVDQIQDTVDNLPLDEARCLVGNLREFLWRSEDELEFEPTDQELEALESEHEARGCPLKFRLEP